jgi:molybdopterin-containing oxidoreductase family membrane subunit
MAKTVPGVLGGFIHIDAAVDAIHALRKTGYQDITVYSAAPNHEIEEAMGTGSSWVRAFTLFGGLTGCAAGYFLTTWMSYDWPVLVGGKPIAALPPYVVIMFELTILLGSLSTVAGMILLPQLKKIRGRRFDPRFTDDRIGIFVPAEGKELDEVKRLLEQAGAVEVTHEA